MPWPVPTARTIAERMAGAAEVAITAALEAVGKAVDPVALSRAVRSARGMLANIFRAAALELREVHDHIAWWGRQYFVDTAEDEFVLRHASIWGVTPRPASPAVGTMLIEGVIGTVLPEDLDLAASDGIVVVTTEAATIGVDGTVSVPVSADAAYGETGNLEAGIRLLTVTPFPEVTRGTIEAPGLAGGAWAAEPAEIAQATLERIRQPPHGGAGFDYPVWLAAAFDVRAVKVVTDWVGRGSVGVIVAMKDGDFGRAPSGGEQTAMLEYLGAPGSSTGVRPVTAYVIVVPAEIHALNISVRLRPDTAAGRAAVTDAFARFVATIGDAEDTVNDSPIGAVIEPSRISEAISSASGEYAHDLTVPVAKFTLDPDQYPEPGVITWLAP